MRLTALALSAAMLGLGATSVSAADPNDFFRFEFYAVPNLHIGTDTYRHHNDFRHFHDYYLTNGYGDPQRHFRCREVRVRGEGRTASRIICDSKRPAGSIPLNGYQRD